MLVVLSITVIIILASVAIHYNALRLLSAQLQKRRGPVRRWVAMSVLGLLLVHVFEAILFGLAYKLLASSGDFGALVGMTHQTFGEYCYYSFVAYTSLGFGDILPTGDLRLMTALETLTGLILIAWSSSFLFLQMSRLWDLGDGKL